MKDIGPLEVGEIKAARFDFSTEAAELATLSAPTVTCVVVKGSDGNPSDTLVGTPFVDGKEVVQLIRPGVVGCTYKLVALVDDSMGLRHRIAAKFEVLQG